ncbi:DUF1795 domain-containing protein [Paenibacillus oenotherae]|uniref:DUF1795 domain-containing protein n=1 Tax=Paenibacillus oenotherae TaxID=1435645 RepID=A0ABS7D469_9BACL|nr:DUF1795 domain-containing protein [Paenibacillus oenotherae]MBW7474719.1 DUF1795 domain-containing protein [Paenibacillus oenotherae]
MKKFAKWSVIIMFMLVFATACSNANEEKKVDLGKVENGTYTNDYFGFSLTVPQGWQVQDAETMNEISEMGKDAIAGGDEDKKKDLDLAEKKTLNLLMFSKFEMGSVQLNPNFLSTAEKVSKLQGINSSKDYLEILKKMLTDSQLPYTFGETSTVTIGGQEFETIDASLNTGEVTVSQKYYCAIIEGYALSFAATYMDDESKADMDNIVNTIKFK